MQYSTFHKRWITPRELLLTQMFPVFGRFTFHGATGSFSFRREDYELPPRKRNVIMEQCGNSMNINMMGVAWLHWLLTESVASRPVPISSVLLRAANVATSIAARTAQIAREQNPGSEGAETERQSLRKSSNECSRNPESENGSVLEGTLVVCGIPDCWWGLI